MSMGHVSTHQLGIADLIRVEKKNGRGLPPTFFFIRVTNQPLRSLHRAILEACFLLCARALYTQAPTISMLRAAKDAIYTACRT